MPQPRPVLCAVRRLAPCGDAEFVLPATLAQHLGLQELLNTLNLDSAPEACRRIGVWEADIATQWNCLAMITVVTGVPAGRVSDDDFEVASGAVIDAYVGGYP